MCVAGDRDRSEERIFRGAYMKKAIVIGLATFLAIPAFAEEPKPVNASQKAVAGIARKPVDCVASVDAAALKAMERTGPLGQMNIYGDPVVLGPNHMRVDV